MKTTTDRFTICAVCKLAFCGNKTTLKATPVVNTENEKRYFNIEIFSSRNSGPVKRNQEIHIACKVSQTNA